MIFVIIPEPLKKTFTLCLLTRYLRRKFIPAIPFLPTNLFLLKMVSYLHVTSSGFVEGALRVQNICAGLFDAHINGGERFHFTEKADEETIDDIYQASKALGTAYVLPTLITSSLENILKGIEATRNYIRKNPRSGVLGMHLEGPFLNPIKRGAHLTEYVRKPSDTELEAIISHGKDVIKLITIAPEMFTPEQIDMLLASGITVSAGHSNATYQEASQAFDQGIKLVTHLYNAMSAFGHRQPGLVGATFDNNSVYAPIIIDGVHCDYAAARIAYKIKKDKLFLDFRRTFCW